MNNIALAVLVFSILIYYDVVEHFAQGIGYNNVYFSSAERSDRDDKCFLVHRTSCVCCTHLRKGCVVLSFGVAHHQSFAGSFLSHPRYSLLLLFFHFFFPVVGR